MEAPEEQVLVQEYINRNGKSKWFKSNQVYPVLLSDIPGTTFLEYPEFLEDYLPWDPIIQKICR